MVVLWIEFILCSTVIVYCGAKLSRYGDVLAEKTGLGRAWIGLILMASVTSLPELITGVSSVALANAPDIALGDVMGSCVFNLAIIALMDMLHGPTPLFARCDSGHILSAAYGLILIGTAVLAILAHELIPAVGHLGLATPAIIAVYAIGVRSVYLFQKKRIAKFVDEMARAVHYREVTTREAVRGYVLYAAVIVAAATWLPFIGDHLAASTGLGRTFFGAVFIAMTTSLPELVVSIAALRIGAADMAVANLFGSNMFNICILAIDDVFYRQDQLFAAVSPTHVVTAVTAMLMTGIAVVSLTFRLEKKVALRLGWDAIALIVGYGINISLLYSMRGTK
jgi:cation:H+ antiporter